jgi:hypothetical protein
MKHLGPQPVLSLHHTVLHLLVTHTHTHTHTHAALWMLPSHSYDDKVQGTATRQARDDGLFRCPVPILYQKLKPNDSLLCCSSTALTDWLTPWSTFVEKLKFTVIFTKFSAFYEVRRFIAVFTTALHWSLSWATWIQSTHRYTLILTFHLRLDLSDGLFSSGFSSLILWVSFLFHLILSIRSPQ